MDDSMLQCESGLIEKGDLAVYHFAERLMPVLMKTAGIETLALGRCLQMLAQTEKDAI